MLKKILLVVFCLVLFFASCLADVIIYERHQMDRYEQTKLHISVEELKSVWGEPDHDLRSSQDVPNRVLFYKNTTGFTEYAFSFDKDNLLIHKYVGD